MYKQFSQILIDNFGVSGQDIEEARRIQIDQQDSLGAILVRKKVITDSQRLEALSAVYDIPFLPELSFDDIDTEFTQKVPIQYLKKHFMVPLITNPQNFERKNGIKKGSKFEIDHITCVVAVNDPASFQILDDLTRILNVIDYKIVFASQESILSIISLCYDHSRTSAEQIVQNIEEDGSMIISEIEDTADLLDDTSDAPIIKLVNHILSQSVKAGASDIHIEPYQHSFKVRYRVDGTLYDLLMPPKWIQPALISRIKVMAKLNIAEKRLPQDGRIEVKIGDQDIDIRVSTIPTTFGERTVLRLLNKSSSLLKLSELGLDKERRKVLEELIHLPNGIILVTGPTGSGKTTSLYAILSHINTPDRNIITIEDPVEYQLDGIGQIQVNAKIDLTFARGLRSIVRQDPDVILVGEIRDQETAEIAVQSALTGHLVFSTVHTNDSASTVTRLVDMGIEPFLISSAIKAVIAQRLIRILCNECKEAYIPDDLTLESVNISKDIVHDTKFYRAKGCPNCFNTGYKGRMSIIEIMVLKSKLQKLILKTFDSNVIVKEALNQGMISLKQDGVQKVIQGLTSIAEVLRVTH